MKDVRQWLAALQPPPSPVVMEALLRLMQKDAFEAGFQAAVKYIVAGKNPNGSPTSEAYAEACSHAT